MKELLAAAKALAGQAGTYILDAMRKPRYVDYKDRVDLVTDIDRGVEELILAGLAKEFPDHAVLAEESGDNHVAGEFQWVIDPIDGTTNLVHGYPFFAVSIAVQQRRETVAGVVFNPVSKEMFSARKGSGAFLNERQLAVSGTPTLATALLATGFPYKIAEPWQRAMELFRLFYSRSRGVRRDGSAALDLCYVAAGRFDGFWEYSLHPWDVAAGMLMVGEAGGRCSDFQDRPSSIFDDQILASNRLVHQEMLRAIQSLPV